MFVRLLCVLFGVFGVSVAAMAADFGSGKYEVYLGDVNDDGYPDIYFHGAERIILLHGDIVTPIVIPPEPSYAQLTQLEVDYSSVGTPTEGQSGGGSDFTYIPYYSDPELVSPSLTETQIQDLGLLLLAEGEDYFLEDFNNDNVTDIFISASHYGRAYIVAGGGETLPTLLVEYTGEQADLINTSFTTIQFYDGNRDGFVDIVFPDDRANFVDRLIMGGGSYKEYGFESIHTDPLPVSVAGVGGGEFRVDENGAATYVYPFDMPSGVAGVKPSVALSYSSQAGNAVAGVGWSLAAGSVVTRCRPTFFTDGHSAPVQLNAEDKFCLDGQRLVVLHGDEYGGVNTEYKTEIDTYKYVYAVGGTVGNPDYFEVVGKDGTRKRYGFTPDSGVVLGGSNLTWALSSSEDSFNNVITYHYEGDSTNHRLTEIRYANDKAKIEFQYVLRPDVKVAYINGYRTYADLRLDRIDVSNNAELIRSYQLSYLKATENNFVSRLEYIQECAGIGENCIAPITFGWQEQAVEIAASASVTFQPTSGDRQHLITFQPADINGDGCQDLVYGWLQSYSSGSSSYRTSYSLSTNQCTEFLPIQSFATNVTAYGNNSYQLQTLDYNVDGYADVAIRYSDDQNWKVYLSRPDENGQWRLVNETFYVPVSGKYFIDIDADGLVDNINVETNEVYLLKKLAEVDESSGSHYGFARIKSIESSEGDLVGFGDFDADGAVDYIKHTSEDSAEFHNDGEYRASVEHTFSFWVQRHDGESVYDTISVTGFVPTCDLSTGTCTVTQQMIDDAKKYSDPIILDINADGLSDVILPYKNIYKLYLNKGDGFHFSQNLPVLPSQIEIAGEDFELRPGFIDYDRDGYVDLYWQDRQESQLKVSLWAAETEEYLPPVVLRDGLAERDSLVFMDVNGDGAFDLIELEKAYNPSPDVDKKVHIYLNVDGAEHNMISEFENSLGAVTSIDYQRMNVSPNYTRMAVEAPGAPKNYYELNSLCIASLTDSESRIHPSCTDVAFAQFRGYHQSNPLGVELDSDEFYRPVFTLNAPMSIVASVKSSAPISGDSEAMSQIDYVYTDARLQAGGRGFLGFETLSTVDVQSGVITTTEYHQDFPFIGRPKMTYVKTSEGEMLKTSKNFYAELQPDGVNYYQPVQSSTEEVVYSNATDVSQPDGVSVSEAVLATTTIDTVFDQYGNLVSSSESVEGVIPNPDDETQSLSFTQNKSTTNEYIGSFISLFGRDYSYPELGRLTKTETTGDRNGAPQRKRTVAFTYYENGLLNEEIIEPDLKDSEDALDRALYFVKTSKYDAFGNLIITEVVGWNGSEMETRAGRASFDADGRYPVETYDRYGRLTEKVIDRNNYGAPLSSQSTNGVVTTFTYDTFGREVSRTNNMATENTSFTAYLSCAQVSPGCPSGARYAMKKSAQNGGVSIAYFDVLGRTMRTATIDFNGLWIFVDTEYDSLGRESRVSAPYYHSSQLWTTTEYDLLGRPLSITAPSDKVGEFATVSKTYDGLTTVVTSPSGNTKRETHNIFGELIKVEDNVSDVDGSYAVVQYTYDIEGNLETTVVTPVEGGTVTTTLEYDRLGRKTAMSDPDKGNWEYKYNAFGELIWQKDGKGQVVQTSYDKLGRVVSRTDYTNASEAMVEQYTRWYYDGETDSTASFVENAIGQTTAVIMSRGEIHEHCNATAVQFCQYTSVDEFGRATQTTNYLNSDNIDATPREQFATSQSYNPVTGRIDITYDAMSGLVRDVQNGQAITSGTRSHYNNNGFLTHTTDLYTQEVLYRTVKTNVRGQVTEAEVGSYGRTLYYNERTGNLERQIAYVGGLGNLSETPDPFTIQHISYEWDIAGNLMSRHNRNSMRNDQDVNDGDQSTNRGLEESFCYDNLNRLIKTNIGTTSTASCEALELADQDQRYDSIGNIIYKQGVGTYNYTQNDKPHAVRGTTGDGNVFNYDANGNLTSDSARTFTYSTFDKPLTIEKGDHTSTFVYGPGRGRFLHIEENDALPEKNTITLYLGNIERIQHNDGNYEWRRTSGASLHTYDTFADFRMMGDMVQRFIFKDHLGSIDVITDAVGNLDQSMSFNPWGERRQQDNSLTPYTAAQLVSFSTDITNRGYTGHEMLDELGLIHMNGRIYDAKLARFVQADPFIQAATDSQMYNRYTYLRNNPMNATDPSGYFLVGASMMTLDAAIVGGTYALFKEAASHWGMTGAAHFMAGFDAVGAATINATNKRLAQNDTVAQILPAVVGVVTSYFCGPCSIGFSALASADIAYHRTGDFHGSLRTGGVTAIYATITWGIGQGLAASSAGAPSTDIFAGGLTASDYAAKIFLHGMVGGVMAELNGGDFGNGFLAAGFSAAASSWAPGGDGTGWQDAGVFTAGVVVSALVGGTASVLSGGKFANGAVSGAVIYALNSGAQKIAQKGRRHRREMQRRISVETSVDGDYHEYKISGLICNASAAGCNSAYADKVYGHVNANDIPFTDNDLTAGLHVLGPARDPITHTQNSLTRTSVNIAERGHTFYPGTVTHQVHFRDGGLYYDLTGVGTGSMPGFNNFVGETLFRPGVANAVNKFGF